MEEADKMTEHFESLYIFGRRLTGRKELGGLASNDGRVYLSKSILFVARRYSERWPNIRF